MKLLRVAATSLAMLLMSALASAQEKVHWDVVSKISEESFDRSQVMEHLWYLSDVASTAPASSGLKSITSSCPTSLSPAVEPTPHRRRSESSPRVWACV